MQDIATAPRDGTLIEIDVPPGTARWVVSHAKGTGWRGGGYDGPLVEPTKWRPAGKAPGDHQRNVGRGVRTMALEEWDKERQLLELSAIEKAIAKLLYEASGYYPVDYGKEPTEISQARLRFME